MHSQNHHHWVAASFSSPAATRWAPATLHQFGWPITSRTVAKEERSRCKDGPLHALPLNTFAPYVCSTMVRATPDPRQPAVTEPCCASSWVSSLPLLPLPTTPRPTAPRKARGAPRPRPRATTMTSRSHPSLSRSRRTRRLPTTPHRWTRSIEMVRFDGPTCPRGSSCERKYTAQIDALH